MASDWVTKPVRGKAPPWMDAIEAKFQKVEKMLEWLAFEEARASK